MSLTTSANRSFAVISNSHNFLRKITGQGISLHLRRILSTACWTVMFSWLMFCFRFTSTARSCAVCFFWCGHWWINSLLTCQTQYCPRGIKTQIEHSPSMSSLGKSSSSFFVLLSPPTLHTQLSPAQQNQTAATSTESKWAKPTGWLVSDQSKRLCALLRSSQNSLKILPQQLRGWCEGDDC